MTLRGKPFSPARLPSKSQLNIHSPIQVRSERNIEKRRMECMVTSAPLAAHWMNKRIASTLEGGEEKRREEEEQIKREKEEKSMTSTTQNKSSDPLFNARKLTRQDDGDDDKRCKKHPRQKKKEQ